MTTPVIIDAIVAVILAAFCLWGAYRGLFRSLAGLVIVVVALVGAAMLSVTFAPGLTALATPLIQEEIAEYVEKAVDAQAESSGGELPEEAEELLKKLGLDEEFRESLLERAEETVTQTGVDALSAVVESIVYGLIQAILFALFFVALLLMLHVLLGAMDLVLKLPGLHLLNKLGGALVGLVQGALVLFFAVWVLRRFGVSFESEALSGTRILHIFTTYTPMSVLSFLQ